MLELTVYFLKETSYSNRISIIRQLLREIEQKWSTKWRTIESSSLENGEIQRLKVELRGIPPQTRGRIVSSRHFILPLSGRKNLNLQNTPILVVRTNQTAVNVYPHLLGTMYMSVEEALQQFLKFGESYFAARGLLEEPVAKIISDNPEMIERGVSFLDANVDVGMGVVDILLRDSEGRVLVVEVETHATENSVAQACRLAFGYRMKHSVPPERVRKVILCLNCDSNVANSSKGAGVELLRLEARSLGNCHICYR